MTHVSQGAQRAAIVYNTMKETSRAHHTVVHVFHVNASVDNLWVTHALSLLDIHEVCKDSFLLSDAHRY
jgi:hypothetical protein